MNHKFTYLLYALVLLIPISSSYAKPIKVNILTDDNYPPYSYTENGKLKGIYIDLVTQAATHLLPEYQVDIIGLPWKRALKLIEQGKDLAILPPYNHSELRPYIFPYSTPLSLEKVVVYCHKDFPLQQRLQDEASNQPILLGINAGYMLLSNRYHKAILANKIVISENKSTQSNIAKLINRRIDCYINDKLTIVDGLAKYKATNKDMIAAKFIEKDYIKSHFAHIGYTNASPDSFPFKDDFVDRMNQAIQLIINKNSPGWHSK